MKRKVNVNKVKFNKLIFAFILLFFIVVIFRMSYLSLAKTIDGVDMKNFVSSRNTRKKVVYAKRGTIYDVTGNTLAQTVNSYTVIAYLSESRSEGFKNPQHVVDKEKTAKELSPILGMSEESILLLLNRNAYQVELGPGGRGISELKKEQIQELDLPGISFISSYKRYYQNDDFSSYILGYVRATDDGELIGEMGIESYYNDMLKGEDGYTIYQQDINGYKMPNTREEKKESVDGVDIYLTIDSNIQFFTEKYVKEACEEYNPEWAITVVADAKTGAILSSTACPSFNPNIKNITNYLNPLTSFSYEPGSTMKTFTYMSAMEKGVYDGNDTFESGSIKIGENEIFDWYQKGFGTITYDEGFLYSSNVGISYLTQKYFTAEELKKYFQKFGFGTKTGIELPGELSGTLNFKYEVEVANAGFGQGITITPIQMIQALTTISNDGIMIKPYIVDKIVNTNNNEIVYNGTRKELGRVVSTNTVDQIKELMYKVIYNDLYYSTGAGFKMNGYDLIGKTGTAQYVNSSTGKYYFDDINYIRSFSGMFPKDDPEVIIYTVMKKPYGGSRGIQNIVKGLVKDIANYKSIYNPNIKNTSDSYKLDNYINQDVEKVKQELSDKFSDIIVIGNGDKIISTYPKTNTIYSVTEKIYLLTNSNEIILPNFINWSKKEVKTYCTLANINCEINGNGYVIEQSIEPNTKLTKEDKLTITLKNKIKE